MSNDAGDEHEPRRTDECPMCEYVVQPITLAELERRYCIVVIKRFHGNRKKSAAALGIGLRTLGLRIKAWKEDGKFPVDL